MLKFERLLVCALALAGMALAQDAAPPPKIALVNMQTAIVATTDGKTAEKRLDAEFAPRKAALDAQEKEIAELQAKLDQPGLSDNEKEKLGENIDHKTLLFNIANQNADGDLREAQKKVIHELGPKLIRVVTDYAKAKGYAMVFDIGESDLPWLYPNAIDITQEAIAEYERKNKP